MATNVQIVFDCTSPDRLARFWAEALHYQLDAPPEGFATWEEALKAWGVPEEERDSASAIVDPEGAGPRIYFQRVAAPKTGKNRVHLDLNEGGGSRAPAEERRQRIGAAVERLAALGATRLRVHDEGPEFWVVMQDPEGNEFCVQ